MSTKNFGKAILMLSLTLAACTPLQLPSPTPAATAQPVDSIEPSPELPQPTATPELAATEGVPVLPDLPDYLVPVTPSPESEVIIGPLPTDLESQLLADIGQRLGADNARASVTVIRAEPVTWPDGSLGCPQPGVFYTQALIEGMWVVYDVGGSVFDYRVDQRGRFFLCENATNLPRFDPNQPTPVLPIIQP